MKIDLDHIERVARAAQDEHPGPYKLFKYGKGVVPTAEDGIDCIRDSTPEPDDYKSYASDDWQGETVLETDGGYYEPRGATAEHIATSSPDVVLALVERVRELEKRCHIVESHPVDYMLEGEPLETQVFILKERLLDERHKTYQLECELAEAEQE